MAQMTRKQVSIAYWGNLTQKDIEAGKSLDAIRRDLRYAVEYSEVLGVRDIETIVEIGLGLRCA